MNTVKLWERIKAHRWEIVEFLIALLIAAPCIYFFNDIADFFGR